MDLKLWEYIFEMFNHKIRQKKSIFSKLQTQNYHYHHRYYYYYELFVINKLFMGIWIWGPGKNKSSWRCCHRLHPTSTSVGLKNATANFKIRDVHCRAGCELHTNTCHESSAFQKKIWSSRLNARCSSVPYEVDDSQRGLVLSRLMELRSEISGFLPRLVFLRGNLREWGGYRGLSRSKRCSSWAGKFKLLYRTNRNYNISKF